MNNLASVTAPTKKLGVGSIASRWRELHGKRSWAGLLDPLDTDLRASIIAYGELAQATYDGFNSEKRSPHAGLCLHGRADLLASSTVAHPEYYTVTKFVYATSGLGLTPATRSAWLELPKTTEAFFVLPHLKGARKSNWMGYVAVATDEAVAALGRRDIVVAWRGTIDILEWLNDVEIGHAPATAVIGQSAAIKNLDAVVHRGFLTVYSAMDEEEHPDYLKTSARDQVREEVRRLMEKYKDEATSITVVGHSLGASLATLNAVDMVSHGVNVPPAPSKQPPCPVTAIVFASPRVGNDKFKSALDSFPDLRILHVGNTPDLVPTLPQGIFGYVDAATRTVHIDTRRSPFLRPQPFIGLEKLGTYHNLECYLHGVAGDNGDAKEFKLVVNRDVALVNKGTDALKNEHRIPANWWVVNNKCMVKVGDGHWKLEDFKEY